MPGPAAHLSIMQLQTARAKANPAQFGTVGQALSQFPRHAQFGSIGPDMLFWADWNKYTPIVNAVFDVYHTLDEIYDALAPIWKPIADAIDKVEDSLTGGLSHSIQDTVALVGGIINTAMLDLITSKIDYWQTLKPAFQINAPLYPESDWNWLDYTHHRATGRFTKQLITNAKASGDASLRAYAYGWMSHITADTVGHAYVNLAVGGPWRTHFQRHHLQENFMDVWSWGFYHTPGVSMPVVPPAPGTQPFDYEKFTSVSTANLQDLIDLGDDLPDNLQTLIAGTLRDVYGSIKHPTIIPFLGKKEINRAYQMQKTAFEIMTSKDRYLGPPRAPKVFGDMEPPTWPGSGGSGSGGGGGGGGFSLSSLLKAIWDFIKDTVSYLGDLALWLISKITSPLTYPVRYALYLIQLGLYEIYRAFRWALVVSAYVYPDNDQLADPFAQQFINPSPGLIRNAPRLEFAKERDHSHAYPTTLTEIVGVPPGPYGHADLNYPFWMIEGEPTDLDFEKDLTAAASPDETTHVTEPLYVNANGGKGGIYRGSLGSAVDFYLRRAAEVHADGGDSTKLMLPDWNIDSDRGYGFKCWEAVSKLEPQQPNGVQVRYL